MLYYHGTLTLCQHEGTGGGLNSEGIYGEDYIFHCCSDYPVKVLIKKKKCFLVELQCGDYCMCVLKQEKKIKSRCAVVARAASGVSQDVLMCKTFSYLGCWLPCKAFNSQFKDATLRRRAKC